ncbi:hypothetical protein BS78_05G044300 [Paspalum vaginatum]|nr:hypothetical protein BS78_05G044300 [Paspalum vaginatum]
MSSPISGRRRNREEEMQTDAAAGAASDGIGRATEATDTAARARRYSAIAERYSRLHTAFGLFPESNEHHGRRRKRARVAASSDAVASLREATAGDAGAPEECAVCLHDFAAGDWLRAMPCSHAFHQDCIFRWLEVNHVCPLCRHALPTQEQDGDEDEGPGYEEGDDGDAGEYLLDRDDDYYVNQPDYYDYYFDDDDGGESRREVERLVLQLRRQHQAGLL